MRPVDLDAANRRMSVEARSAEEEEVREWGVALVAENRRLRETLESVNAGMDHADDCWMATPGPAECNCPMAKVREALGLEKERR